MLSDSLKLKAPSSIYFLRLTQKSMRSYHNSVFRHHPTYNSSVAFPLWVSFVQSMMAVWTRQQMKLTHGNGIIPEIPGISLQIANTWRRWTLLILMGSKEDTLQSTLNKGDPNGECYQTILCRVLSRDTVMVHSRGFLASPRR